jgi:predicted ATP-grasp superfamily ATP-dependent carboligase
MTAYTIGIDPDADANGVAVYHGESLVRLCNLTTIGVVELVREFQSVLVSIENVMANQFVYTRNQKASKAAQSKVAMHIGRCQQAQVELMRWLDHLGVKYVLHKPTKSNWAKDKAKFEMLTGWKGRSNEDTRSAAFFGFLEAGRQIARAS